MRCARPGCNHRRRRHIGGLGACRAHPRGHCSAFVVPATPTPDYDIRRDATTAQINATLAAAPEGATIRFEQAVYDITAMVKPRRGQRLVGPAELSGGRRIDFVFHGIRTAADVTLDSLTVSSAIVAPVALGYGWTLRGCLIRDGGSNGIRGNFQSQPARVVIEDTEIRYNGWNTAPGAVDHGGMKVFETGGATIGEGVVCRRVACHHNSNQGLWWDHDCAGDIADGCEVWSNTGRGIYYEVGRGPALITRNYVHDNDEDGVRVTNTGRLQVTANRFANNGLVAIRVAKVDRTDHGLPFEDVLIADNALGGSRVVGCEIPGVRCERNI